MITRAYIIDFDEPADLALLYKHFLANRRLILNTDDELAVGERVRLRLNFPDGVGVNTAGRVIGPASHAQGFLLELAETEDSQWAIDKAADYARRVQRTMAQAAADSLQPGIADWSTMSQTPTVEPDTKAQVPKHRQNPADAKAPKPLQQPPAAEPPHETPNPIAEEVSAEVELEPAPAIAGGPASSNNEKGQTPVELEVPISTQESTRPATFTPHVAQRAIVTDPSDSPTPTPAPPSAPPGHSDPAGHPVDAGSGKALNEDTSEIPDKPDPRPPSAKDLANRYTPSEDELVRRLTALDPSLAWKPGTWGKETIEVGPYPGSGTLPDGTEINGLSSPALRFARLPVAAKKRLAAEGSAEERHYLIRDPDAEVHVWVLRNPGLTLEEAVEFAALPTLGPEAIRFLLQNRRWATTPDVVIQLILNPATPPGAIPNLVPVLPSLTIQSLLQHPGVSEEAREYLQRALKDRSTP